MSVIEGRLVKGQTIRGWLITLVATASVVGMVLGSIRGPLAGTGDSLWPVSWLAWSLAGWMVLIRRPGNRVGRLCLAIGATWGLAFGLQSIVLDVGPAIAAWIELAYTLLGILPWLLIVMVLNTFPSGRYAGRPETVLGRAVVVVGAWALIGFLISPAPLTDTGLENPLAVPELSIVAAITSQAGFRLVVILALVALARLIVRSRRSSGVERQQFRWLMLGGSLFLFVSTVAQFVPEDSPADLIWFLGALGIPVSIGVAVLRYRLYEIDRIVSRTVTYLLVVGLLASVFFAIVTTATSLLPARSDLAVAASTLAIAALFNPVRRRVQVWIDRRFNRARFDAQRVMDSFAESLRDWVDPNKIADGWRDAVAETMQPSGVSVWIRP